MTPAMVKKAVAIVGGKAETEASGNMSLTTVARYAKAGVGYISVGSLTHSAPAADLSLQVELGRAGGCPPIRLAQRKANAESASSVRRSPPMRVVWSAEGLPDEHAGGRRRRGSSIELLRHSLVKAGYGVYATALTGEVGLEKALASPPSLILLDLMLPGLSGLEIAARLRKERATAETPIIMLTAKGEEEDIIRGLEAGADDYVVKPFSSKVLLARIATILRRAQGEAAADNVTIDGLVVDRVRHEAILDGTPLDLTFSEFAILDALLRRRGGVMTRQQIVADIRGGEMTVTDRSVDVHMTALRRKLGSVGARLLTVRGVGYRFDG